MYKNAYKENLEKHKERNKSSSKYQQNGGSASKKNREVEGDIWNCQRNNNEEQYLKGIPLDERGKKNYIESRKQDFHYEMDFLPPSLVYNYGDHNFLESKKQMEKALEDMLTGIGPNLKKQIT
jgi:hypothetical protein